MTKEPHLHKRIKILISTKICTEEVDCFSKISPRKSKIYISATHGITPMPIKLLVENVPPRFQ